MQLKLPISLPIGYNRFKWLVINSSTGTESRTVDAISLSCRHKTSLQTSTSAMGTSTDGAGDDEEVKHKISAKRELSWEGLHQGEHVS